MRHLAEYVDESFAGMPEQVYRNVRIAVTDFFGVAMAALGEPVFRCVLEYVRETGKGPVPLPGCGDTASAQQAALAWGTLGHALDYDDISAVMIGPPSVVLVPVLASVGFERNCSGKEWMEAYIAGYEAMAAVAAAAADAEYARGWHTTSAIGIFGAAVAACRLMGLSREQTEHALGIAASLASGLRANFGSMTKPLHAGWAASSGVFAAKLAEKGFESSPAALESAQSYSAVYAGLSEPVPAGGKRHIQDGIIIKLYPCCGFSSRLVDCSCQIREMDGFAPERVESVVCRISPQADRVLRYTDPEDGNQAKFSLEYCTAQALLHGQLKIGHFADGYVQKAGSHGGLRDKIRREVIGELKDAPFDRQWTEVIVRLAGGKTLKSRVDMPKGYPQNPLSDKEFREKFADCLEHGGRGKQSGDLFERLMRFDDAVSVAALVRELASPQHRVAG